MTDCHSVIIREANPFAGTQQTTRATMIKYPFPLREGVLAALDLPSDMTKREAKPVRLYRLARNRGAGSAQPRPARLKQRHLARSGPSSTETLANLNQFA